MPPDEHPGFYAMSRFTLNITRDDMVRAGYSPSVRLFEAGACGTPILSDIWLGIDEIFVPDEDIMLVAEAEDVLRALLDCPEHRRSAMATALQRRVQSRHTARHRAAELEEHLRRGSITTGPAERHGREKATS